MMRIYFKKFFVFSFLLLVYLASTSVHAKPKLTWSEESLEVEVLNGTVAVKNVSFVSKEAIEELSFKISARPRLDSLIEVVHLTQGHVVAGTEVKLAIVLTIPADTSEGDYSGTLHVRDGRRTLARPLKLNLSVTHGSSNVVPDGVTTPTPDRITVDTVNGQLFTIDQAEIILRDEADFGAFSFRLSALGGIFAGQVPFLPFYQIRFPGVGSPEVLDNYIEQLQNDPDVLIATREWRSESRIASPNDPEYYDDPWFEVYPSGRNAPWEFTKFYSAWDDVYEGKDISNLNKINIAVVDYGFTYHPDLKDNVRDLDILLQTTLLPSVFLGNYSHGTSVAGVIGAVANNATGVVGGIWNTKLRLYDAGSITGIITNAVSGGSVYTDQAMMQQAIEDGAQVLNYSQGHPFKNQNQFDRDNLKWRKFFNKGNECDPQAYCTKNTLFVFAAPNYSETGDANDPHLIDVKYDFPSSLSPDYENIISVTGVLQSDFIPVESQSGVFYPSGAGGDVTVAAPGAHWVAKTVFDGLTPTHTYGKKNGTSYAAPMVSAIAGVVLTKNPDLTPKQIKDIIVYGACAGGKTVNNALNNIPGSSGHPPIDIINAFESLKLANNPDAAKDACNAGGGKIAFLRRDGGSNLGIYVMNADGSEQIYLTNKSANFGSLSWSPDGTQIVFSDGDVYVINANGTGLRNLTNSPPYNREQFPSWSPDGSQIMFASDDDIYVMNADGTGQRNLTNNSTGGSSISNANYPRWSPDGSQIAYSRGGIYVVNANGTGQRKLTNNVPGSDEEFPSWSPDSTRITFTDISGIYVINADGSDQKYIGKRRGAALTPIWSPDNTHISYIHLEEDIERPFDNESSIYVLNSTNMDETRIYVNNNSLDFIHSWSPDGSQIVFSDYEEIYVINSDGSGQAKNITNSPAFDRYPSWCPVCP